MSTIKSSNEHLTINASGAGKEIKLQNNGTTNVTVASDGDVGIGTASPNTKLHIDHSGNKANAIRVGDLTTIGSDTGIYFRTTGNAYISTASTGDHVFDKAGTERMRILSSGGITFNGDTSASNALDDYEEGTWTPTVETGTASYTSGYYTKIGNLVHCSCIVYGFSDRTSANTVRLSVPFTVKSGEKGGAGVMFRYIDGTSTDSLSAYLYSGTAKLEFFRCGTGNYSAVMHSHLNSSSSRLIFSFSYYAA